MIAELLKEEGVVPWLFDFDLDPFVKFLVFAFNLDMGCCLLHLTFALIGLVLDMVFLNLVFFRLIVFHRLLSHVAVWYVLCEFF